MMFTGPEPWIWMGVWVAVLLGMVWLVVRDPGGRTTEIDAIQILNARFARGEVSQEEFERARDSLREGR